MSRIQANPSFKAIEESLALLEKENDREYSLNINKYRAEQQRIRDAVKKIEELNKAQQALNLKLLPQDEKRLSADADKLERRLQWTKNLSKDIYLGETVNIVNDMISHRAIAMKNK
jgi:carboxyl-terminal processing protease